MKRGFLSEYFEAVAVKRLTAVEADVLRSHQHEFNGNRELKKLFGTTSETSGQTFPARFIYLTDIEEEPVVDSGPECFLTWYDARAKSVDRTGRSEYRLYFPTTRVSTCSAEGDVLILGRLANGLILVVVAECESTIASQLCWLFGVGDLDDLSFTLRESLENEGDRIGFTERVILEQIGVEVVDLQATDLVADMLTRFNRSFPSTKTFSDFTRTTLPKIIARDDPDHALMEWMEREEQLFRALERELIAEKLERSFSSDVDGFLSFSLSVQNRRKSRAGAALENHLSQIFTDCGIRHSRAEITESRSRPDFVFPGIVEYRSATFPTSRLTMLGSKTSCKDRWRQLLVEAARIDRKHLLTLEAAISEHQTREMQGHGLQLVLPRALHETFTASQQQSLMSLRDFVGLARVRQDMAP